MRIGISARVLDYESGGTRVYARNIIRALMAQGSGHSFVIFHASPGRIGSFPGATELVLKSSSKFIFDWILLPRGLRRAKVDFAFFPTSTMPWGVSCASAVMMHDLGYFHSCLRMYPAAESLYMRFAMRTAASRATRLFALSEFTRSDMARLLKLPRERIEAIHPAADPGFLRPVDRKELEAFRSRAGLPEKYFLYPGSVSPRKNLGLLLRAIAPVAEKTGLILAVTGGRGWGEPFSRILDRSGCPGDAVRQLGHVPDEDMACLYRGALAVLYPSLFEGFGLPIVEAQACGCPVICSDRSSLPEAAGKGALILDAEDAPVWTSAMLRLAGDQALREDLSRRGLLNAGRFSWDLAAGRMIEVFEQAARR